MMSNGWMNVVWDEGRVHDGLGNGSIACGGFVIMRWVNRRAMIVVGNGNDSVVW